MTDVKVSISLRVSSKSNEEARACNFTEETGTLGEVFDVVAKSDLVILLTSDASQARLIPRSALQNQSQAVRTESDRIELTNASLREKTSAK